MNDKKLMSRFVITSAIGVILFMIPIKVNGSITILVKVIADFVAAGISGFLPVLCVGIITISAILSVIGLGKPKFLSNNAILRDTFITTPVWVIIRVVGAIFVWITYILSVKGIEGEGLFGIIASGDNGSFILYDLLTMLVLVFVIASFLLPLLTDFGLLEYVGALLTRVMRPLFKIPGRAAVDCITSWIGDGTLGVMLTCNQYEEGYYSAREASIIATTFSAISITYTIIVLAEVDLMQYFGVYYLIVCLIGVACAIIVPRIPPLSLKKDTYLVEGKAMAEDIPEGYKSYSDYGLHLALERVSKYPGLKAFLGNGAKNAVGMWFGVLPTVMAVGTFALIISNETAFFDYLGLPFKYFLEFLKVPEAVAASKSMVVGFVDMFAPVLIAVNGVTTEITRFIIAVISVTQVIFLSEVGGLILGSKLPINIFELFVIFIERTIISLIIVCPLAHLLF